MTRRYTDREVSLIFQRALEPDAALPGFPSEDPGLSLDQIKAIAVEVGIDPGRIDHAASGLLEPSPAPSNPYAGIPTTVQFQTTVEGLELASVPRHEALAVIRGTLGRQGILSVEPDSFEWKARDPMGGRYVSFLPSPRGVRISVLGNYRDGFFTTLLSVGGAFFVAAAAILSGAGLGPAGILLGAAAVALIPPRFAYRWWRKREDATMAALHGRLLALLKEPPPQRIIEAPEPSRGESPPGGGSAEG